ncbi:hypothetical protein BC629DRAFT_1591766 [Irpex lacteus]|nr:hypothetical protein BC629DRAFT_1591766 [Irpex lacteus]
MLGSGNEALKQFDQYDYIPKPVPSIHRTHGHLIFEGKAEKMDCAAGEVARRGRPNKARRYRRMAECQSRDGPAWLCDAGYTGPHCYHVSETTPRVAVADGQAVKPSEVGRLVVVEQSVGSPPKQQSYDLSQLQEGEVWVYRPIGMELYIGAALTAQCPEGVAALSI